MLHQGILESYNSCTREMSEREGVEELTSGDESLVPSGCGASPCVLGTKIERFLNDPELSNEIFGPATLLVSYSQKEDILNVAKQLEGQLTVSLFGNEDSLDEHENLLDILETKAGRLLFNQFPTGVEVCSSIVHGGPYPATTDSRSTSVGTGAILRFARPVCYQGFPDEFLPQELQEDNPLGLDREEG